MVDLEGLKLDSKTLKVLKNAFDDGKDPYKRLAKALNENDTKEAKAVIAEIGEIDVAALAQVDKSVLGKLNSSTFIKEPIAKNIKLDELSGEESKAVLSFFTATARQSTSVVIDVTGGNLSEGGTALKNVKLVGVLDGSCKGKALNFLETDMSQVKIGPNFTADTNFRLPKDKDRQPKVDGADLSKLSQGQVYVLANIEDPRSQEAKKIEAAREKDGVQWTGKDPKGGGVGQPCTGGKVGRDAGKTKH